MLSIVNTLLPVFALILVGFCCERLRVMPESSAFVLNRFVFNLAMPSLIFVSVATRSPADLARAGFAGGSVAGVLLSFVLIYVVISRVHKRSLSESGVLSLLGCCANNMFLGLPILAALFPGNSDAVLASTISNVVSQPLMLLVILELEIARSKGGTGRRDTLFKVGKAMLINPILLSVAGGAIFCLGSIPVPEGLQAVCRYLGSTTTPCALTALGMVLGSQVAAGRSCDRQKTHGFFINTVKLAVQPALTWLFLAALGVDGNWLAMGVLLAAMPTASIAYVVSENYHTCSRESSRIILVNTAASVITIPALVLLLRFFALL